MDPASMVQLVNRLIRINKNFDLVVVFGTEHGCAESEYGSRRMDDLVRHLFHAES